MKLTLLTDTPFKMCFKSKLNLSVNRNHLALLWVGQPPVSGFLCAKWTLGDLIIFSPGLFVHLLLKVAPQ